MSTNVVELYKYQDNDVLKQIMDYLHLQRSENTAMAYKMGIESFYNKHIEELSEADLVQTKLSSFKNFIMDNKNRLSGKTIKNKVTAVKGLLKHIKANYDDATDPIKVDISYFDAITELTKKLDDKDNFCGRLTVQEVWEMADWAQFHERVNQITKYYLILFSLDTCARLGECLKLKWSYFEPVNELGEVQINTIGKGNKNFYPKIKKWFYDKLVKNLNDGSEYVFNISQQSVSDMIIRYREVFNIPEERNIVFHSIRGTGITFKYHMAGNDLEAARRAANHSNYSALNHYMAKEDQRADGAVSLSKELNTDLYKHANREDLIKVIEQLSMDERMKINMKLNKLMKINTVKHDNDCKNVIKWI